MSQKQILISEKNKQKQEISLKNCGAFLSQKFNKKGERQDGK